ncbi:MAG: hypothetical protein NW226_21385 [Microscillaceae bacterium]|nr:hypothetical protein [Microscillaceae bacterium]
MFLSLLNPREKLAFLALAKKVIISDKIIAQSEMVLYKSMRREMDIMDELLGEDIKDYEIENLPTSISQLCAEFTTKKAKISALMELIGLGFVDGKFVAQEREIIYEIALYFGIRREETDSYIDWATRLYGNE